MEKLHRPKLKNLAALAIIATTFAEFFRYFQMPESAACLSAEIALVTIALLVIFGDRR